VQKEDNVAEDEGWECRSDTLSLFIFPSYIATPQQKYSTFPK